MGRVRWSDSIWEVECDVVGANRQVDRSAVGGDKASGDARQADHYDAEGHLAHREAARTADWRCHPGADQGVQSDEGVEVKKRYNITVGVTIDRNDAAQIDAVINRLANELLACALDETETDEHQDEEDWSTVKWDEVERTWDESGD